MSCPAGSPVWLRVSATDWVEDGWDLDETIELAQALKRAGSPALHVSTGGVSPKQAIKLRPGYQVPHAERIKAETGLTTIAVGLITEAHQAETILQEGKADAISLARAMLYDPRWPWHAAAELGAAGARAQAVLALAAAGVQGPVQGHGLRPALRAAAAPGTAGGGRAAAGAPSPADRTVVPSAAGEPAMAVRASSEPA